MSEPERYEVAHRRVMVLSLVFTLVMSGYLLAVVFGRLDDGAGRIGQLLAVAYFAGIFVVRSVTLPAGRSRRRTAGSAAHCHDEWMLTNRSRAAWTAFWVMLSAQVPLMYLMRSAPTLHSLFGMAGLSMTLGLGAFFGSYLYFSRLPSDG